MSTRINDGQFMGQPAFTLESAQLWLVILPRISGKIASLVDKSTDEELLWRNPDRGYREPAYGDDFALYDTSGWEDCLPNIAAGPYPEWPWRGVSLPDHGEVWALPWEARIDGEAIELAVHGVRLPYRFEKRVSVDGNRVHLLHRITNPTAFPMRYIWATHPLFRVRPGTRIVLPEGVRVRIDSSIGWRLGQYLDELSWPIARDTRGQDVELDRVGEPDLGFADKLYTTRVDEGWCGLYDTESRRAVALTFDPEQLPNIGIRSNQGGWPSEGPSSYNVGLEPTCGYPDALDVAHERGAVATIAPGERQEWAVTLHFGEADSVQALLGKQAP
jgi:hypothetical protein